MIKILELTTEYCSYVNNIIKDRWEVSNIEAEYITNGYLSKQNYQRCFLSIKNNSPIGMGCFNIDNDVGINDLHPWCLGLWVEPEERGNGVGHKLTLARFDFAKTLGYKKIYLDTTQAEEYHLKFGWKRNGRIGIYHGESTIIMEHKI